MLKNIALALVVLFAVGCGAGMPQRPTVGETTAIEIFMHGGSLVDIQTSLALRDRNEARDLLRGGLIKLNHSYVTEY